MQIVIRYNGPRDWRSPRLDASSFFLDGTEDDAGVRRSVFIGMNHWDDNPCKVATRYRVRSMMVGDEVDIIRGKERTRYRCEPSGWEKVEHFVDSYEDGE